MTEINLLLLGERGVGKTTFINALVNYFSYEDINAASSRSAIVAAPVTLSVVNSENNTMPLSINPNLNEKSKVKVNTKTKEYILPVDRYQLRLIDSPGFEPSENVNQADFNNVFKQLGHLQGLHGVCFFLKSSMSKPSQSLEYLIRQTLTKFDASIVKKFIFIFTGGRKCCFHPYTAQNVLKEVVCTINSKSPDVNIPFTNDNIYCVDNEGFINLVAYKCGVTLNSTTNWYTGHSWKSSVKECKRLITYVSKLNPVQVQVNGTIEKIQAFLKKNSYNVLAIFGSNYKNFEKCKKLQNDSEKACKLIDDVKNLIQQTSRQSFKQSAQGKIVRKEGESRESHELDAFMNDCKNKNQRYKNTMSVEKTKSDVDHDTTQNVKKTSNILLNQKQFIANVYKVIDLQQKEICKVLRNMAEFAVFLETCGGIDNLEAEIASVLPAMRENKEADVKIFEELQQAYEQMKVEVRKQARTEINNDIVLEIVKELEILQHYQEVMDKIFNI